MIKNANSFLNGTPAYTVFLCVLFPPPPLLSEDDLITWKMKQGLMIQSLQPIGSPYKNELPRDVEVLFGLQKVK